MFYTLTHAGYEFVKTKIMKLNRIAQKINQPEIQFELIKKQVETDPKTMISQTMYYIMCIGEAPKLKDWKFMCTLDFTPKGNLFNFTYDSKKKGAVQIPDRFRHTPFTLCEDCKVKRYRNRVFVLYNEEKNKWMQVGSTCLGAFLGVNESEVHQLAEFARTLATMPNAMSKWANKTAKSKKNNDYIGYKIGDLLNAMFLSVNEQWKKYASYYSLVSYAYRAVRTVSYYGILSTIKNVTKAESDMSTAMLKYFETWKAPYQNTFYDNMLVVLKNQVVAKRHYKFLAEAFKIYIRNMGKSVFALPAPKNIAYIAPVKKIASTPNGFAYAPKVNAVTQVAPVVSNKPSTYLGTIGSMNEFNLDTVVVSSRRNFKGKGSYVLLKDANGNELNWFCPYFYRVNDNIRINKAFVLKHQMYNGVCQTVIGNVTFTKK